MTAPPAAVAALANGRPATLVWTNELGGQTFRIDDAFIKWVPAATPIDLDRERVRLAWAVHYVRVPTVIGHGRDDEGSWLATRALPADNAIAPHWVAAPAIACAAIGAGLRAFHDALPVATCPFSWSIDERLANLRDRAARGELDPSRWNLAHRHLAVDAVFEILAEPPPIDRLVVCHGDTCAPNTLVDDAGRCSGHVDLGALGVADRWADLAIATWSTTWNYGPGWETAVLDAYGVAADEERTRYYRLLWDLVP